MVEGTGKKLWSEIKEYGRLRLDYAKLVCAEKISVLLSGMAIAGIMTILALVALFYLAAALQEWLALYVGAAWSFVIVAAVFGVLILVVWLLRMTLIVNPIARFVSKLFIDKKD